MADIRLYYILILHQSFIYFFGVESRFVVEVLEEGVLDRADVLDFGAEFFFVHEEFVDLEADLRVLVRIARRDARFRGAERAAREPLLLVSVEQDVIGHQDLGAVRYHQLRRGNASFFKPLQLFEQLRDVERHSVSQNAGDMTIEYSGREKMESELSVFVLYRVSGVASSLEADDYVRLSGEHVGDLSFSFVAPVGAYYCFDHCLILLLVFSFFLSKAAEKNF